MTGSADAPEWEEHDKAMFEIAEKKWKHIIGHECGHATASLANGNCPDGIQIGRLEDEYGRTHYGLTRNSGLPDTASAEAKATVLLAGLVAENLLFGSHDDGSERDLLQLKPVIDEIMGREGETRSATKIQEDLMANTASLLQMHMNVLKDLYEGGMERAQAFGFVKLNDKGSALQLLTREMLQHTWDVLKP